LIFILISFLLTAYWVIPLFSKQKSEKPFSVVHRYVKSAVVVLNGWYLRILPRIEILARSCCWGNT